MLGIFAGMPDYDKLLLDEDQATIELLSARGSLGIPLPPGHSKYAQLLAVIEEMGRDIRPTYAGSRSSAERLKRGIVHARVLVRECLLETERSAARN